MRKRRVIKGEFPTCGPSLLRSRSCQYYRSTLPWSRSFKPTYSTSVNSDDLQESSAMRLLHSLTLAFEEFGEEKKEPYAILSHRWGLPSDEVSYQEMLN